MTPYADMSELERCQMLAEFAGYPFAGDNKAFNRAIDKSPDTYRCGPNAIGDCILVWRGPDYSGPLSIWNPFKDANALEEVEAAILKIPLKLQITLHSDGGAFVEVREPEFAEETSVIWYSDTKADALAQVVHTLMERKG